MQREQTLEVQLQEHYRAVDERIRFAALVYEQRCADKLAEERRREEAEAQQRQRMLEEETAQEARTKIGKAAERLLAERQKEQEEKQARIKVEARERLDNPDTVWGSSKAIVEAVARVHGVTYEELVGQSRVHRFVAARQDAMAQLRRIRKLSHPRIGQLIGGRDHSTITHGLRKMGVR